MRFWLIFKFSVLFVGAFKLLGLPRVACSILGWYVVRRPTFLTASPGFALSSSLLNVDCRAGCDASPSSLASCESWKVTCLARFPSAVLTGTLFCLSSQSSCAVSEFLWFLSIAEASDLYSHDIPFSQSVPCLTVTVTVTVNVTVTSDSDQYQSNCSVILSWVVASC